MKIRRALTTLTTAAGLTACAAPERRPAEAPSATPGESAPASYAPPPAQASGAYAPSQPNAPPPAPPPPPREQAADAPGKAQPSTAPTSPVSRAVALREASSDIESSQRELDVVGGDCKNACRALGSMDRAAGRICGLAQSNDELRRCGDAKIRVYSARDKVKSTCGTCPDVSVERDAPIPSR